MCPIPPPSINGTALCQLCHAVRLSEIFISCVKTDSLWSFNQAVQRFTTSHRRSLSWLHLGASCFTAMWGFEWGCLMLLGGEENFSIKKCKSLDSGLNWCLMTSGLFRVYFFFLSSSNTTAPTTHCRIGTAPECKSSVACRCIWIHCLGGWMHISSLDISCK